MKIIYNNLSKFFRTSRNLKKIQDLTEDDHLIFKYKDREQEDSCKETDQPISPPYQYNMRENVTISITNTVIV